MYILLEIYTFYIFFFLFCETLLKCFLSFSVHKGLEAGLCAYFQRLSVEIKKSSHVAFSCTCTKVITVCNR